jgi:hypothetical protein
MTLAIESHTTPASELPTSLNQVSLPDQLPPIVMAAFTRPELVEKVLEALAAQTLYPPKIFAYIDGVRGPKDSPLVQATIEVLQAFSQTIPVEIIQRPENMGCDRNVIAAVTEVLAQYPSMVHLEDDVVPNPDFYDRICRLLAAYQDHPQVFSVSAYANYPEELAPYLDRDFMVSNRVFSFGFSTWADRWQAIDLANKPEGYNAFGSFSKIPATIQTKYTMVNQFFIEKNRKTDWCISMTLASLEQGFVHIVPTQSFIRNIGFGHAEAINYRNGEPDWANAHYQAAPSLDRLPLSLELHEILAKPLSAPILIQHLQQQSVWLNPIALWNFLSRSAQLSDWLSWLTFFNSRFMTLARRVRSGLPT